MSGTLPPALDATALRILSTSDLGARTVPLRTSYGESGTCAGVVELLERERERQPAIWLDVGDLVVGSPAYPLLGERPWGEVAELPIAASAVGNHEFDDGVDALLTAAGGLSFPLLCANVDIGLPRSTLVDTDAGPVGVIGLTYPCSHELSQAPPPAADWHDRVISLAQALRRDGARWVVALLHDGVEWWPSGTGIATRSDRLQAAARPWAAHVDLVLAGHNFGTWAGTLDGTPAVEPHLFAASVGVVDLAPEPIVRGVFPVPAVRPAAPSPATEATAPSRRSGRDRSASSTRCFRSPRPATTRSSSSCSGVSSSARSTATGRPPTPATRAPTGWRGTGAGCRRARASGRRRRRASR